MSFPGFRALLMSLTLVPLAACGAQSGDEGADKQPTTSASPTVFNVRGEVVVDSLGEIEYRPASDRCVAVGDLADTLAVDAQPLVIRDPSGKQVALGTIDQTTYETVGDFVSPGICHFHFSADDIEQVAGVYTAAVPDLEVSERFTADDALEVIIKYDP